MRSRPLLAALAPVVLACGPGEPPPAAPPAPPPPVPSTPAPTPAPRSAFAYPPAPRGDVVDDYHGVKVPDPYRWLEELDSPQTRAWIAAENQLTDLVLGSFAGRDALRARLVELEKFSRFTPPLHRGAHWFWTARDPGQQQRVLYTASASDATGSILVDPNALSPDGSLAYVGMSASERGDLVGYGMSAGGGDWQTWHFRDVNKGADLPDTLEGIKYYEPQVTPDGKGVYYSRFPAPQPGKELSETDHDCKVLFHRMGTPASSDVVVYERTDQPSWQFEPTLSPDGRFLVVAIGDGEVGDRGREEIVLLEVSRPGAKPVEIVSDFEAEYVPAGIRGDILYFVTTAGAKNKRIVAWNRAHPSSGWKEIVPESADAVESAVVAGSRLLVTTLKDAHSALAAYDLSGKKLHDVDLPGIGTVYVAPGGMTDGAAFASFAGFATPPTILAVDLARFTTSVWHAPALPFAPADFETKQVFYPSKDGTKVPMFITSRKGVALDGKNPTLLTGYGGFGFSYTPHFDSAMIAWMEHGGVFAVANIRGGGEYGEAWHRIATLEHKQTSFDDFIAGAEWLESNGYTSKDQLGIVGRSGGGALVATVAVERPDLFAAVAPLAGVLDLLRYPLFGQGAGWEGDWGSPDVPSQLEALRAYSPLHNVRPGTAYPAMYIVTADHDVRVAPIHSYKFTAAVQAAQAGPQPILLRVETMSGHGGGTTLSSKVDQSTEELAFFLQRLGDRSTR
jgi:prolyl oligopeptidase